MKKRKQKNDTALIIGKNLIWRSASKFMNVTDFIFLPSYSNNRMLRLLLNLFILLLLLSFWFLCSLFFVKQTSFSVLDIEGNANYISTNKNGKLLKGDVERGEFTANENFLGIVKVRFKDLVRSDFKGEDVLQFRIKEKGSENWYYINNYRAGILENQLLFPFGFPIIENSKDKNYIFEIESLLGTDSNAVTPNAKSTIISGYQLSKQEIFGSKKRMVEFLIKKVFYSFTNKEFLLNSTIYLIPLGIFILIKLIYGKNLKKRFFISVTSVIFILDIFFISEIYLGIITAGLILWIFCIFLYKLDGSVTFLCSFVLILFWVLFLLIFGNEISDKLSIWVYSLFVIGMFQFIYEEMAHPKNLKSYKELLSYFLKA